MKKVALKKSLKLWQMHTPLLGEHLSERVLKGTLEGRSNDAVFAHLASCNLCRQKLWKLQDAAAYRDELEDYVLPLAASVGVQEEGKWTTEDNKYRIEYRKIVSEKAKQAVVVVTVLQPFDFTGKDIVVRDAAQQTLLRGRIGADGQLAAIVEDVDSLDLKKITVSRDEPRP